MTECERIIEQGILPKSFFEPETICDFYVDEKRKKIWAVELDLLFEFDRVCKKYGLRYFLIYGSLLGAIRHNGFIPWDDDIDVTMPRHDYDIFVQLKEEFCLPYFLQTPYTDNGYFYSFAKLRNSNTTGASIKLSYNSFNQGMSIDIFPLDYMPSDTKEAKSIFEKVKQLSINNSTFMRRNNPCLNDYDKERVAEYSSNPMEDFETINSLLRNNYHETKQLYIPTFSAYPIERNSFDSEWFLTSKKVNYYGRLVSIPNKFENVLYRIYGDYMSLPDVSERGQWHCGTIFDSDLDYKESLKKLHKKTYNNALL